MREQRGRLERQIARCRADTAGITADAGRGWDECPVCGDKAAVLKTSRRRVATLAHGSFVALEHVTSCPNNCLRPDGRKAVGRSERLAGLVPPGNRYGYDIEVFVGIERFLKNAQRDEIRGKLLAQYGICISAGEISGLTARFLAHVETLHFRRAPSLCAAMGADGGYPMHIDATTEGGAGTMLAIVSGWRRWVLGAWKIPSERVEYISPRITETAGIFGEPCAIMRDLGKPMRLAAAEAGGIMARPPRHLECHFHFLADVGRGLLDESYGRLRGLARAHSIREKIRGAVRELRQGANAGDMARFQRDFDGSAMEEACRRNAGGAPGAVLVALVAQWVLEYRQDSGNSQFPFGRPLLDLYSRCQAAANALGALQAQNALGDSAGKKAAKLQNTVSLFIESADVAQAVRSLRDRIVLFDNLRAVFRLDSDAPEEMLRAAPGGINGGDMDERGKSQAFERFEAGIKRDAESLLASLKEKHKMLPRGIDMEKALKIVIDHFDCHWQYLWGHLVRLAAGPAAFYRVIDRTNNLLETFFHDLKHRERRRSGRKNLSHDFAQMPASAAIAANLLDADYVRIVCGSLNSLPLLFSQIDQTDRIGSHRRDATLYQGVESDNADFGKTCDLPNNKAFVRKPAFNEWMKSTSHKTNICGALSDTVSTDKPLSPFEIIDNHIARYVHA